jgi:hypothetical protein
METDYPCRLGINYVYKLIKTYKAIYTDKKGLNREDIS